ncbi:MAG: helix-turn-helix transcriptional regulator [Coprobacillus cateniformis]|uniref:DNA-binding transcriptional ArsR family regulator n=1 Tax=Longibaculum muris TaxID=1796628 RepID=A0A4R3Z928_9FIRM|nr:metalloregulator ArsR/SmtB family transcription factor [Longibaculum muris]KXU45225.1 putative transcriptional repressor SmtB [Candidatus Stoquefichus sp. KLE1796]MBS5112150.1 helix-turn-helix transcriptional regulator [Coprobacillus cateniformis]MBS5368844.1 helix-turn-helix transcriptional regulator [Coprobacillus cateniformis]MCR1888100.1 metalloregulator ArsR/SmtB family transcription factor [Longibaculum muris]MED9810627.1 metalloregulator ArsR/SmtB family transcription factor [Longiba
MDKSTIVNQDVVNQVVEALPDEEILYDVAELFKVFGDSTRIKIICALFESEMCVYDLAAALSMTQSAISHQLRILKTANLVKFRREGKLIYYSLDDEHVQQIFDAGYKHVIE